MREDRPIHGGSPPRVAARPGLAAEEIVLEDAYARFGLRAPPQSWSGVPTEKNIVFSPRFGGRTYTVEYRTSLTTGTWAPLTAFTTSDAGIERTVTDKSATGAQKFSRVKVSKP